jgi:chemotaxis protein MotA
MDLATIGGLIIGIGGILLGQVLEGGHVGSIMQMTAAIIVFAGTFGAVMVGSPMMDIKMGFKLLKMAFFDEGDDPAAIIKDILEAAQIARKDSILAIERKLTEIKNPYMKTVFRFVVDGVDANTVRSVFEDGMMVDEEKMQAGAKIFADAGGFSPTVGIIGAVLGLIHVMENLADASKLGAGIAVAFVATVYGVGAANLIFIPLGNKLKRKIKLQTELKEMIVTGALGIIAGLTPFILEEKLRPYLHGHHEIELKEGEGGEKEAS